MSAGLAAAPGLKTYPCPARLPNVRLAWFVVTAALAGCLAAEPPQFDLSWDHVPIMGLDFPGHLEVQVNGAWLPVDGWPDTDRTIVWMPAANTALLEDTLPTPQGGGGQQVQVLPSPATALVRLVAPPSMAPNGTIAWIRTSSNFLDIATDETPLGTTGRNEPLVFPLEYPGLQKLAVRVSDATGHPAFQSFATEALHVGERWSFTGKVQPQQPNDDLGPFVPVEDMADRFTLPGAANGLYLEAHTRFDGAWVPGSGTDINLAVYGPDGKELQCSVTDDPNHGPPAANETLNVELRTLPFDPAALETVWVGYTPGFFCGPHFGEGYYTNPTPVPYRLDLVLWPIDPVFIPRQ